MGLIYSASDSENWSTVGCENKKDTRETGGRERERGNSRKRGSSRVTQGGERKGTGKKPRNTSEELTFGLSVGDQGAFYDTARAFSSRAAELIFQDCDVRRMKIEPRKSAQLLMESAIFQCGFRAADKSRETKRSIP